MNHIKLPHAATIAGIIVLSAILVGQRLCLKKSFPEQPMKIALDRNVPMISLIAGDDEIVAKLRKGDTVLFLGVVEGNYHRPYGLLVQTKEGERGLLAAAEMGFPMMLKNKKDSVPVTVKSLFREKGKKGDKGTLYYNIVTADGEKMKVNMNKVRPILPDSLTKYCLQSDGDYFMTKAKFEKLYIGHKLDENDARYRPAWLIDKTKKGYLAYYPNIEVIDFSDGKIRNPMVVYDTDSVAVTYGLESAKGNNRYLVKWLPFLGKIVDTDFFASFIEGSIYNDWIHADNENYTEKADVKFTDVKWYYWLGAIVWIVLGLAWVFLIGTLPSLILEAGLYCRYLYYHLSDGAVVSIFGVVTAVFTYLWFILMTVWGCLWLFLPVIVIAGFCVFTYSERKLGTLPHERCLNCRQMEMVHFRNSEFVREYDEWRHDSRAIASHTDRWKTWTDVTTRWSDGSTTHSRENERNHSRTTTLYADYNVLYHVKLYHNHYQCDRCGNIETLQEEKLTELMRHKTGEHTTVHET